LPHERTIKQESTIIWRRICFLNSCEMRVIFIKGDKAKITFTFMTKSKKKKALC